MNSKNITLVIASVFALMFFLAFASATLTSDNVVYPSTAEVSDETFQITFDLTNNDTITDLNWGASTVSGPPGCSSSSVSVVPITIADGLSLPVTVSVTATITFDTTNACNLGAIDVDLQADYTDNVGPQTFTLPMVTVNTVDTTAPVITLLGNNPEIVFVGENYTDTNATWTDNYDTGGEIVGVGVVDTNTVGTYPVTYDVQDTAGNNATQVTRTVVVIVPFCNLSSYSDGLELDVDIENKGQGEDDKWLSLDTIEVTVGFENDKDSDGEDTYDLEDVTFELALYKADSAKNVADDLIWLSEGAEEFEFGDVDEGKKAEHTFKFRMDPSEFEEGDYRLMIKVYGEDDNGDEACIGYSDDLKEKEFGFSDYYAEIKIKLEGDKDKMVVLDTENFPKPLTASCEQKVTFTADVWNIGDGDFEDQILVTLYNSALGIDQNVTVIGDLDSGDMTQVTFSFDVPEGMDEKTYNLEMKTYYDYDENKGKYLNDYDEESEDTFTLYLKLEGNCVLPKATVSASLESGGKAGQKLVVRATVTNSGEEESTYTFSVTGYTDWASSPEMDNTLTLAVGQSQDILVSFDVKKTSSGEQTFDIEVYSEGKLITTQPVQVAIEAKKGFTLTGFSSSLTENKDGALAILIALITAIAIAIIIVLIVRAYSRKG